MKYIIRAASQPTRYMSKSNLNLEKAITGIISIGFGIWSAAFIYGSSFIAIDGKRYFCLFDDAMISMRYAWNFSHGEGLVWNPGEYIQGYTNLLMTLLMSLATLVFDKSTAALCIQLTGVSFMLAIAYVTVQIANYFIHDVSSQRQFFIRLMTFLCPLLYYPLVYWSLMGMETGLLTLLCLLGVLAALDYSKNKNYKHLLLVAVYFGLAYLTRNDSIIFAVLTWLYIAHGILSSKVDRNFVSQLFSAIGLYALFVVGQGAFQYSYYGELLPNTYTLKLTGMPLSERIQNGTGFILPFLNETSFILIVSSFYLIANMKKEKLLLISIPFSAIVYQIYVGGDPWSYWRIMSPSMPLLFILYICAISSSADAILNTVLVKNYFIVNPKFPRKYIIEVCIIFFTLLALLSVDDKFLPEMSLSTKPYQAADNQHNVNTAIAITQLTTSDATVGVFWAGTIPYFSGRKAFDFLGKCDKNIARLAPDLSGKISENGMKSLPGHNKYDLNYSIKVLKPTYVQKFKWGSQDLSQWATYEYDRVKYKGSNLFLLKNSPAILK